MRDWDNYPFLLSILLDNIRITLPMRDWDFFNTTFNSTLMVWITLPMRDWDFYSNNSYIISIYNNLDYITYEGLRHILYPFYRVSFLKRITLPMRDWDKHCFGFCVIVKWCWITLPMRDWDFGSDQKCFLRFSDYITYERLRPEAATIARPTSAFVWITLPMRDWD